MEPRHSLQICREGVSLSGKQANAYIQEANSLPNANISSDYSSHPVETLKKINK